MIEAINKHMCCTLPIFERLSTLSLHNDKCGNHFSALKPVSIKFFVSIHRIQCHFCFLLTAPQKESSPAKYRN